MIIQTPYETPHLELNQFLRDLYEKLRILPTFRTVQTATNYTAEPNDYYIGVTDTAAPRTITLPALASLPDWIQLIIKDESGAAGANNITVDADGTEEIDGALTQVISSNYGVLRLRRNQNEWLLW
jgi:hypothetical protein